MSDYLGWRERKPPLEYRVKFDVRDTLPGGPMSHNYEDYVKNVFRSKTMPSINSFDEKNSSSTGNKSAEDYAVQFDAGYGIEPLTTKPPPDYSVPISDDKYFSNPHTDGLSSMVPHQISAKTMLKMEQELGKDALDDSNDATLLEKSPLEQMYDELGIRGFEHKNYQQYQVYQPKSSSEYFHTMYNTPSCVPSSYRSTPISQRENEKQQDNWRKTDRQYLVDYKNFSSSPLSPYMYLDHPYTRQQDSRIVGSNFVQLTTRPRDAFLEKIDKTLAEVRALPRY